MLTKTKINHIFARAIISAHTYMLLKSSNQLDQLSKNQAHGIIDDLSEALMLIDVGYSTTSEEIGAEINEYSKKEIFNNGSGRVIFRRIIEMRAQCKEMLPKLLNMPFDEAMEYALNKAKAAS